MTGASRGIGRATALLLAGAGAGVAVVARSADASVARVPGTILETAAAIREQGGQALAVSADVSKEDQVAGMVEQVLVAFGRVDILVNNAAVCVVAPFLDVPLKRWDLVFNVNLRGSVLCARALLPHMIRQGGGSILNVSSSAGRIFPPGMLSYGVSKRALEALTEGLALEVQDRGVSVNCLQIEKNVATEGWTFHNPQADTSDWETPESAAQCLLWLAAQDRSFTGKVLTMEQVQTELKAAPPGRA